ncbi:MAG: hypothetical protein ABII18_10220 [bacterium]
MKYAYILIIALLIFTIGCSQSMTNKVAEKVVEKTTEKETGKKADINISDQGFKMTTAQGAFDMQAGENAQVPKDLPKDIYLWPKAKINMVMQMPQGLSISLQTTDALSKVATTYKAQMAKNGWKETMSMDMGGQNMLAYKKADRTVQVVIAASNNETVINITAMTK